MKLRKIKTGMTNEGPLYAEVYNKQDVKILLENICGFLSTGGNTQDENVKNVREYAIKKLREVRGY